MNEPYWDQLFRTETLFPRAMEKRKMLKKQPLAWKQGKVCYPLIEFYNSVPPSLAQKPKLLSEHFVTKIIL